MNAVKCILALLLIPTLLLPCAEAQVESDAISIAGTLDIEESLREVVLEDLGRKLYIVKNWRQEDGENAQIVLFDPVPNEQGEFKVFKRIIVPYIQPVSAPLSLSVTDLSTKLFNHDGKIEYIVRTSGPVVYTVRVYNEDGALLLEEGGAPDLRAYSGIDTITGSRFIASSRTGAQMFVRLYVPDENYQPLEQFIRVYDLPGQLP